MQGAKRRKVIDMEEEQEKKNFEIVGDAKRKIVRFGAAKTNLPRDEQPKEKEVIEEQSIEGESIEEQPRSVASKSELPVEEKVEKKTRVNDSFAKLSAREPLKPGEYPRELKHQFSINSEFEAAFEKLDQGVKEGYLFYFSGPKLTASITNRIVKKIERIKKGQGLNDCTCGLSKNLPNCDGSHKNA